MELGNILTTIMDNIWNVLPVQKIHEYEQGLRWTWGKAGKILHHGIHLYFPYLQSIDVQNTKLCVIISVPQTIGQYTASFMLTYKMVDIKERYLNMQDSEEEDLLLAISKGCVADILAGKTEEYIIVNKPDLETDIVRLVQGHLRTLGYEVDDIKIIEYTKSKAFRLLSG